MTRMSRIQMAAAMAIALLSPQQQAAIDAVSYSTSPGSPWRTKLRNTRTSVAAMKRAARKRRNVRARSSKRGRA